jgi:hypothetical protein
MWFPFPFPTPSCPHLLHAKRREAIVGAASESRAAFSLATTEQINERSCGAHGAPAIRPPENVAMRPCSVRERSSGTAERAAASPRRIPRQQWLSIERAQDRMRPGSWTRARNELALAPGQCPEQPPVAALATAVDQHRQTVPAQAR